MCFVIVKRKKKPMNRVVWKVLRLVPSGHLLSPYNHTSRPVVWQPGETKELDQRFLLPGHRTARQGFYVYLTEEKAHRATRGFWRHPSEFVVVKLQVSPKDLLRTSSIREGMATYRKVHMPENQPYVEFYDD